MLWEPNNKYILTVLVVSVAISWYLWPTVSRSIKKMPPLPPGPYGLPIVGYLPFLGTNLHTKFTELASIYGSIYKLRLGRRLCIVLNSESLAREVGSDLDITFANRDPPIAALAVTYGGLDIAWSPYGPYWRNMRKVFVHEMLSSKNLDACHNHRKDEVRKTIRDVYRKIDTAVDIGEITFLTELNVIMSSLWGRPLGGEKVNVQFRELIARMIELEGVPNISDFFPVLARFDMQGVEREAKRVLQQVDKILDTIIDERANELENTKTAGLLIKNEARKDFLNILLELKDQEDRSAPQINITQIKAMLIDIVVGGTDTSATMVEWAMAEIINNPDVMEKVQEELTCVVGMNTAVEEFHLTKLQYLDAVLKETFRLHPALPLLIPRRPIQSCTVGGYTIPKDTKVFVNVWAIHRDPQLWENPSKFNPERYLSDATQNLDFRGNSFKYFPFGSGRRICAGLPLAEKMIMYIVAALLHSFTWRLPQGEELDLSEKFGIVLKKRTPLIAIPSQRLMNLDLYL